MTIIKDIDFINNEMLSMSEIVAFIKLSDKWVYKQIALGKFPKQVKFGTCSRWYKSEIIEWLNKRTIESRA